MEFNPTSFMDIFESCFCMKKRSVSSACVEGDIEYVKRVLKNRADAETEDSHGEFPILMAVKSGKVSLVRYLFGIGASVTFSTQNKWSLLHEAVASEYPEMVKYILKRCPIPTYLRTKDMITPLHLAAFNGDKAIMTILLMDTPGDRVSPRGVGGITPMMIASKRGDREMMKKLYRAGASFFEINDTGKNSVTMAKESNTLDVVHELNIGIINDIPSYPRSKPIFIDTIQSRRNQRKKVFFGIK